MLMLLWLLKCCIELLNWWYYWVFDIWLLAFRWSLWPESVSALGLYLVSCCYLLAVILFYPILWSAGPLSASPWSRYQASSDWSSPSCCSTLYNSFTRCSPSCCWSSSRVRCFITLFLFLDHSRCCWWSSFHSFKSSRSSCSCRCYCCWCSSLSSSPSSPST